MVYFLMSYFCSWIRSRRSVVKFAVTGCSFLGTVTSYVVVCHSTLLVLTRPLPFTNSVVALEVGSITSDRLFRINRFLFVGLDTSAAVFCGADLVELDIGYLFFVSCWQDQSVPRSIGLRLRKCSFEVRLVLQLMNASFDCGL